MRDDEPRPVWMSPLITGTSWPISVCLLLQYLLQSSSRGGRAIVEERDDEPLCSVALTN
jgi:hypothetical protein